MLIEEVNAMAESKASKKTPGRSRTGQGEKDPRAERFKRISKNSSQIVTDAAMLLDEEIAAGIVAAKQVQQRFQKERRIDPSDFKDALTRFRGDAHEVVNMLDGQFSELRSEENTEIFRRFTTNTHSLLDLVVELVNMGAEVADQLVQQSSLSKKPDASHGSHDG